TVGLASSSVRLVGIRAQGLLNDIEQRLLFEEHRQDVERTFYGTLDAIRDRYGVGAIGSGRAMGARGVIAPVVQDEESLFALGSRQSLARIMKESAAVAPTSKTLPPPSKTLPPPSQTLPPPSQTRGTPLRGDAGVRSVA
ncbi:MAG: hypothetical protein ABI743_12640, partial [bacterium]